MSNEIKFDNEVVRGPELIAERFNEYFVESIAEISNSIPFIPYALPYAISNENTWNSFQLIDSTEL